MKLSRKVKSHSKMPSPALVPVSTFSVDTEFTWREFLQMEHLLLKIPAEEIEREVVVQTVTGRDEEGPYRRYRHVVVDGVWLELPYTGDPR